MPGTSGAADVERVYAAMEEAAGLLDIACSRERIRLCPAAGLLDIACSRERIRPILDAYQDVLSGSVVVYSMASGRHATELDLSVSVPPGHGDPYAVALAHGLTQPTDHPVGALLSDTRDACPVTLFAIDAEATGGFKKTYAFFPADDLQSVTTLAAIPSMPPAVAENAELFARYGLTSVQMTSMDYNRRQVNLYFGDVPRASLEPEAVVAMCRDMGLREPAERALRFARRSFAVYPTLSWDSSRIERLCFAVISTDPTLVPSDDEADIALFSKYATNAPYAYAGERRTLVYGLTLSATEEYYKLGSYYQITDHQRRLLKTFDSLTD